MSNSKISRRKLSVYEKQQLYRANLTEVELLSQGDMPVEYLTGRVDFAGIEISVNPDVLISRVETEELVTMAVRSCLDLSNKLSTNQELKILELGTGSGAISLALMSALSQKKLSRPYSFLLTDVSAAALAVAKKNHQRLLAEEKFNSSIQIKFLHSDLLSKIKNPSKFDLILANLPYIPSLNCQHLDSSVKDFEPLLALDGGETGFELIARALEQILTADCLTSQGKIILEVDESHDSSFLSQKASWILKHFQLQFIKDQFDRQRFIILTRR